MKIKSFCKLVLLIIAFYGIPNHGSSETYAQGFPNLCDSVWNIEISGSPGGGVVIVCYPGGPWQCDSFGECLE